MLQETLKVLRTHGSLTSEQREYLINRLTGQNYGLRSTGKSYIIEQCNYDKVLDQRGEKQEYEFPQSGVINYLIHWVELDKIQEIIDKWDISGIYPFLESIDNPRFMFDLLSFYLEEGDDSLLERVQDYWKRHYVDRFLTYYCLLDPEERSNSDGDTYLSGLINSHKGKIVKFYMNNLYYGKWAY